MKKRLLVFLTLTLALASSFFVLPSSVHAGALVSQGIVLTCNSLSGPITFTANRDTTGTGAETFNEIVSDGYGVLFQNSPNTLAIGASSSYGPATAIFNFRANPITYTLVSYAGNGQPQQILFTLSFNCASLPTVAQPCTVAEGAYQGRLTSAVKLYWDKADSKAVTPDTFIPAGKVVSIVDNATPGWVKIQWACGIYYIKAGFLAPNTDKYAKPYLPTR